MRARSVTGQHRADDEAGFVLPAVLAILIVVSVAAASAVRTLQAHSRGAAGRATTLRLQGLADGAVRFEAMALAVQYARRRPGPGLPEKGTPITCPLPGGETLSLSVQDQAGLIDINVAPRPMMEDAFRSLGVPDRDAAAIAAEIVDARDPDDVPEPNGAEAPQYRARGLAYGPPNAPLGSIDEVEGLPSMTESTMALLRPFITVHNPSGALDISVTPGRAFAGSTLADGLKRYASTSPHQIFAITAVVAGPGGSRAGRSTVMSINAPGTRTGLLGWRATKDVLIGIYHPACSMILTALSTD